MINKSHLVWCLFVILTASTVAYGQQRPSAVTQPPGVVGEIAPGQRIVRTIAPPRLVGYSADPVAEAVTPATNATPPGPATERVLPGPRAPTTPAAEFAPPGPATADGGNYVSREQPPQVCEYYTVPRARRHGWFATWKECMQRSHWGYAEYFQEPPVGASVRAHMGTHVANGRASQMILYHLDFVHDEDWRTSELNDVGRQRLWTMAKMLESNCFPIIIQPAPENSELDANRRAYVLGLLANWGFPVPEERVVVGVPRHRGLSGDEAYLVHQNLLDQTQSGSQGQIGMGSSMSGGYSATPIAPSYPR